jgi:hypothetical protein
VTTSQKILSIASAVVALMLVLIQLQFPAWFTPASAISAAALTCLSAILAVIYPVTAAIGSLQRNRAAAQAAARKLPRSGDANGDLSALMNAIYADCDSSGIPYKTEINGVTAIDPVPIAPRISQALANMWNSVNVSMSLKLAVLDAALTTCSAAFKVVTGLTPPATWDECADYNKYWRLNQIQCAVHSEGLFRQVLMPLRTCLKIKDTGDI